jgi:hypothetical protein
MVERRVAYLVPQREFIHCDFPEWLSDSGMEVHIDGQC